MINSPLFSPPIKQPQFFQPNQAQQQQHNYYTTAEFKSAGEGKIYARTNPAFHGTLSPQEQRYIKI